MAIVRPSAEHRRVLAALNPFWTPHPAADARLAIWTRRSLAPIDRDTLVAGSPDALDGCLVAQPASRPHVPAAHDFLAIDEPRGGGAGASVLLDAAEAASERRGSGTAFVVRPAAWTSKLSLLEDAGDHTAMTWPIKR